MLDFTRNAVCVMFYTYSLSRKTKTATAKVGDITQNIDLGYACFQEKYYRVCIAKAAVNETVSEDSHADHVQFATAADSQAPFRTWLKSFCKLVSC